MNDNLAKMREAAKRALESGDVGYVIGWGATKFPDKTSPLFMRKPEDAERLVWNEYAIPGIAKYLLDDLYPDKPIGVFVRGCDSRAINRMMKDNRIKRENLRLLGIPCDGKDDERCTICRNRNPLVYDELLWDEAPTPEPKDRYFRANAVEAMSADGRYAYWSEVFDQCIRCYACRNICPACNCKECYVDMTATGFQGKQHSRSDNLIFGVTRAFHVGDRCIECGECERVCPMGLPIMGQTQKILKDINELVGDYESGVDAESENYLGVFDLDDKDEFM
ncbi:MAG: 4Fe-4S dicluster domain-containing protein [Clostridiales Family XIII bacterium]|jgi:ferredoxin|nr:4Fe-4S dicluster domain-containing protein [Clostridiales Family XIII bacterium]